MKASQEGENSTVPDKDDRKLIVRRIVDICRRGRESRPIPYFETYPALTTLSATIFC